MRLIIGDTVKLFDKLFQLQILHIFSSNAVNKDVSNSHRPAVKADTSNALTSFRSGETCMEVWKAVVDVPCNLQRVVESSTTRCRLHGTSTTAFHKTWHRVTSCMAAWCHLDIISCVAASTFGQRENKNWNLSFSLMWFSYFCFIFVLNFFKILFSFSQRK